MEPGPVWSAAGLLVESGGLLRPAVDAGGHAAAEGVHPWNADRRSGGGRCGSAPLPEEGAGRHSVACARREAGDPAVRRVGWRLPRSRRGGRACAPALPLRGGRAPVSPDVGGRARGGLHHWSAEGEPAGPSGAVAARAVGAPRCGPGQDGQGLSGVKGVRARPRARRRTREPSVLAWWGIPSSAWSGARPSAQRPSCFRLARLSVLSWSRSLRSESHAEKAVRITGPVANRCGPEPWRGGACAFGSELHDRRRPPGGPRGPWSGVGTGAQRRSRRLRVPQRQARSAFGHGTRGGLSSVRSPEWPHGPPGVREGVAVAGADNTPLRIRRQDPLVRHNPDQRTLDGRLTARPEVP